jgi:hypothetical protein
MNILPLEILYKIYEISDIETKINFHRIYKDKFFCSKIIENNNQNIENIYSSRYFYFLVKEEMKQYFIK